MRRFVDWFKKTFDGRDGLGALGFAALAYGGEHLYPGAGFTVAGAVAVAIAALVR